MTPPPCEAGDGTEGGASMTVAEGVALMVPGNGASFFFQNAKVDGFFGCGCCIVSLSCVCAKCVGVAAAECGEVAMAGVDTADVELLLLVERVFENVFANHDNPLVFEFALLPLPTLPLRWEVGT